MFAQAKVIRTRYINNIVQFITPTNTILFNIEVNDSSYAYYNSVSHVINIYNGSKIVKSFYTSVDSILPDGASNAAFFLNYAYFKKTPVMPVLVDSQWVKLPDTSTQGIFFYNKTKDSIQIRVNSGWKYR